MHFDLNKRYIPLFSQRNLDGWQEDAYNGISVGINAYLIENDLQQGGRHLGNNIIRLENITKRFGDSIVVNALDLYVLKNEFLTILGPSGCGKTTTLRMIGGFEKPTAGKIFFNESEITSLPPYERKINTVFQKYALFPHMDVFDNIAFGLRIKKIADIEIKPRVERMLDMVGLNGFEKRHVQSLSGGQQQRIAIARALVNEPDVLLLDEPLGALDLKLRKDMQLELKDMQRELGITFVYVTHDQEEALTMSDTIVVMEQGIIQQIGAPEDIYNEPKNRFVADFIGESNILDATMICDRKVSFAGHEFVCVDSGFGENSAVDVVVRPEDITVVPLDKGQVTGTVESVVFKGVHYEMLVAHGELEWLIHSTRMNDIGTEVGLYIHPEDIHIMKRGDRP